MRSMWVVAVAMAAVLWSARPSEAEPRFLSKQYTRCTTCHISPTGGGLLSAYGRSLSHRELSTTGAAADGLVARNGGRVGREAGWRWSRPPLYTVLSFSTGC